MDFGLSADWGIAFKSILAICIILIGAIPFIVLCAAYLIVAKFMVGLLLTVGTIFICFAFFPSTRSMFTSWTGQCFNYILLSVFFTLLIGGLLRFIETQMSPSGEFIIEWGGAIKLVIVFFVSIFLIGQVPVLSSSLTGGVGINGLTNSVSGMASKASNMGRSAGGAALGAGKGAAGLAAKGAGAVWGKLTGKGGVKAG